MRMLFTLPNFWPYVRRGSERLVHDLAQEMGARGHRVTVVTRGHGARVRRVPMDGFEVVYCPTATRLFERLHVDPLEGFMAPAFVAGLLTKADVACAFYPVDAIGLSLAARFRRRPFIVSVQGWPDLAFIEQRHPRLKRPLFRAFREAARVTVLSKGAVRRMWGEFGVESVALYPGTFTAAWLRPREESERRTIVCSAAVDDERKRVDLLVRAFVDVAKDIPDLDLLLVGPGDATAVLERARALDPEIAPRITHRFVESSQLPSIFARCTIGALTSVDETFGLVVLVYLAAGMPAVGSDDAGIPEIITPGTGELFRADDAADCAAAIRRALALAEDPASVERCRSRATEFEWSRMGDAYEALFLDVVGRRRAAAPTGSDRSRDVNGRGTGGS